MTFGVERGYASGGSRVAVADDSAIAREGLQLRRSLPIARCHPERPLYSAGKCEPCYLGVPAETLDPVARERAEDIARELAGEAVGDPVGRVVRRRPRGSAAPTVQELRVLRLIRDGATNKDAANELEISEQTIKNHMTAILRKLGARDRTHAVVICARRGFLSIGDDDVAGPALPLVAIANELAALRADVDQALEDVRRALEGDSAAAAAAIREMAASVPASEPAAPTIVVTLAPEISPATFAEVVAEFPPGPCTTPGCDNALPIYKGRGRPRRHCLECKPSRAKEAA